MNNIDFLNAFNSRAVPSFTPEEYRCLQQFNVEIPEGTDTLAGRVQEFNTVTHDLAEETRWNKTMPWVVAAIEISLIAATVLGFVFGGPLGMIPLLALFVFEISATVCSDFHGDIILPPFGAILYITHLIRRQSKLEARHQVLSQELPGAIRQAAIFWQANGAALLGRAQEATRDVLVEFPEHPQRESFQEMGARLELIRSRLQTAHNRKTLLIGLAHKIEISHEHLPLSVAALALPQE